MLRSIASIIIGYAVMSIAIMAPTNLFEQMLTPAGGSSGPAVDGLSVNVFIFSIIVNFLAGVVGGYTAARIAGRQETAHALALAVLRILVGVVALVAYRNNVPIMLFVITSLLLLPAAYLGGYLRTIRRVADEGTMTTNI